MKSGSRRCSGGLEVAERVLARVGDVEEPVRQK